MPEINTDIPIVECFVDPRFLTDGDEELAQQAHPDGWPKGVWFAVRSVEGQAIACRVLIENGAQFVVPLHALWYKEPVETSAALGLENLELWDAPSCFVAAHEFGHLAGKAVDVRIAGAWHKATYLFTLDWRGTPYADDGGKLGFKDGHILALDSGQFAAQPNNRLRWHDPAFIEPFQTPPPYRTNTTRWSVENRRPTGEEGFFYSVGVENQRKSGEGA